MTRLNFAREVIGRRIDMIQAILDNTAAGKLSSVAFSLFDLCATANKLQNKARQMMMTPIATSFVEFL